MEGINSYSLLGLYIQFAVVVSLFIRALSGYTHAVVSGSQKRTPGDVRHVLRRPKLLFFDDLILRGEWHRLCVFMWLCLINFELDISTTGDKFPRLPLERARIGQQP